MCDRLAAVQLITLRLRVVNLTEEGYGENAGEWDDKAERPLKQRTSESRKDKEEVDRREDPRVKFQILQSKR